MLALCRMATMAPGIGSTVPSIQTVTGPLPVASVRGPVLAHEHLILDLRRAGDQDAALLPTRMAPTSPQNSTPCETRSLSPLSSS